jgi:hypothetical protein
MSQEKREQQLRKELGKHFDVIEKQRADLWDAVNTLAAEMGGKIVLNTSPQATSKFKLERYRE